MVVLRRKEDDFKGKKIVLVLKMMGLVGKMMGLVEKRLF